MLAEFRLKMKYRYGVVLNFGNTDSFYLLELWFLIAYFPFIAKWGVRVTFSWYRK
jgi:hypothetical protein